MAAHARKILMVDDDLRMRELLQRYLGEQGFTVKAVSDATEMNAAMATEQPDVIVLVLADRGADAAVAAVNRFAITRMRAAAADLPLLELACIAKTGNVDLPTDAELAEVCAALGEDADRWDTFARLSDAGPVPFTDLATVAVGVLT